MGKVVLFESRQPSEILINMTDAAVDCFDDIVKVAPFEELPDLRNTKIIFSVQLSASGYCPEIDAAMSTLWDRGRDALKGSSAMVIVHNDNDLFTKTYAQNLILHANMLGCNFTGRPYVEAVGNLSNLLTAQKTITKDLKDVAYTLCHDIAERLCNYEPVSIKRPKLAVLHSSNVDTSNTMRLWDMVSGHLDGVDVNVVHIENGTVKDCIGLSLIHI